MREDDTSEIRIPVASRQPILEIEIHDVYNTCVVGQGKSVSADANEVNGA